MECTIINNKTGNIISKNFNINIKDIENNNIHSSNKLIGIYKIEHIPTRRIYIGSSCDILSRWKEHKRKLQQNIHHSYKLQQAWNDELNKDNFSFEIVELVNSRQELFDREQYWIDFYNSASNDNFNVMKVAGEQPQISNRQLFYDYQKTNLGDFIFINSKEIDNLINILSSGEFMKILFLATFIKTNGKIGYQNNKQAFNKNQIRKLFTSNGTCMKQFFEDIINNNILIKHDDNSYSINTKYFYKGSKQNLKGNIKDYIKLYVNPIKILYIKYCKNTKKLLPLFQLLPYCNKKYNILCDNPSEKLIECVNPLTFKNINDILKRNTADMSRLRKNILNIKYNNQLLLIENNKTFILNPIFSYQNIDIEQLKQIIELFNK